MIHHPFLFPQAGVEVRNRLVVAPMTNTQSHDDGTLGEAEYRWLTRRAEGGFGMIITCASHVQKIGQGWIGELGCYDDRHISGLARLAAGIRGSGSVGVVQLFHAGGRTTSALIGQQPVSASERLTVDGVRTRALRAEEMHQLIDDFAKAAQRVYQAGFHGVEVHGAHGYLLAQFLNPQINRRTDEWGGDLLGRSRLLREVVRRIRQTLPRHFLVGVRLSPESIRQEPGIDTYECLEVARQLVVEGVDYLHYSLWNSFKMCDQRPDLHKALLTLLRDESPRGIPIMVAGEIITTMDAERAMDLGADFVALGRMAISNPDWPQKAKMPDFQPKRPPYRAAYLQEQELSLRFIDYMRRWPGFVQD